MRRLNQNLFFVLGICVIFTACEACSDVTSGEDKPKKAENALMLSLVNWNVQTFFDAETDGNEYEDFVSAAKWSKDKYLVRLQRLCDVMQTLNADVYVFEEIENEAVIYDISNQLIGETWSNKNKWHYACFAKDENASIGCAVISRFPLCGVKTHCFDARNQKNGQPSVRPIVQVTVMVGEYELVLFANHWKSKVGSEEDTEIWRDWQESVLGNLILNCDADAVVLCGDFNRDAQEFVLKFDGYSRNPNTVLRVATGNGQKNVMVYNPWFDADGDILSEIGSYYFDKDWERIDNIFSYGNVKLSSFGPKAEEPWANEAHIPMGYKIYTGMGYSDHLPIMCMLVLGNEE